MERELKYKTSEIPYRTLSKFGLKRQMVDDLPSSVMDALLSGHYTPPLPFEYTDINDNVVFKFYSRICLQPTSEGEVDVLFSPRVNSAQIEMFDPEQQERLKDGLAVMVRKPNINGALEANFYQIDPLTNQLMYVPAPVIANNLAILSKILDLKPEDLGALRDGNPVSVLTEWNAMITVGVDLNADSCIRLEQGDEVTWTARRLPSRKNYDFGINGCWIEDVNGNMTYVLEEDYTEEIYAAQRNMNMLPQQTKK